MEKKEEHFHIFEKNHKDEEVIHYDICILGGGPAGLTAALYSSRYCMHTALVTKEIGGMANLADRIENYPGFEGSGMELMQKFWNQARKFGAEYLNSEVANLHKDKTGFIIELKNGKVVHSKTIIIALGTEKRKLNIPGEQEFLGKGVSYCATCDAAFFRNKVVSVIGGSNSAAKAAVILSKLAEKVYIIYRKDDLRCDNIDRKAIEANKNIEIICNSIPVEIKGDKFVKSLVLEEDSKKRELKVQGVFIEVGEIPVASITKKLGIKTDEEGYIHVDEEMKTNVSGIFAAGDTIKSKMKQVVIAASQGAIAAKSAREYLSEKV